MVEVIEDGVTEGEYTFEKGISHVGLQLFTMAQRITNPRIITVHVTYTTPTKLTITLTSLYETSVV